MLGYTVTFVILKVEIKVKSKNQFCKKNVCMVEFNTFLEPKCNIAVCQFCKKWKFHWLPNSPEVPGSESVYCLWNSQIAWRHDNHLGKDLKNDVDEVQSRLAICSIRGVSLLPFGGMTIFQKKKKNSDNQIFPVQPSWYSI